MQLLKSGLILLLAALAVPSCKTGPRVSFCVLDAPNAMLRCADPDKKPFDLTLTQADNYGCMSPDDWERLLSTVAKAAPVRMKEPVAEA